MATLREIIDNSNYAVFFGGAGVSTASNIPDFRGKNGIYNTENEWGLPPEIIISHTFFTRRTKDFYDYYKKYMVYPSAVPNAVHIALARLEKEGKIKAVLTQNIDGLHQAAVVHTSSTLVRGIRKTAWIRMERRLPARRRSTRVKITVLVHVPV